MLNIEIVAERIKEAMGSDTQQVLADKVNATQGGISKILRKEQMPTTDTIYSISRAYNVSVDWLLGLSDVKGIAAREVQISYKSVVESIVEMVRHGNVISNDDTADIHIKDLLLRRLCLKGVALQKADYDSYKNWVKDKLVKFEDKPLLWAGIWDDEVLSDNLNHAMTEEEIVSVYDEAHVIEQNLIEFAEGTEIIVPYKLDE